MGISSRYSIKYYPAFSIQITRELITILKFTIQPNIPPVKGVAKYIGSEYSFDFEPVQSSNYDILIGDLTISFDANLKARQIWGYNPSSGWINKKLSLPTVEQGALILNNEIDSPQSIDGSKAWKTYYDSHTGWICIGTFNVEQYDLAIEFATKIFAVLHNGNLKSVWIKPIFM